MENAMNAGSVMLNPNVIDLFIVKKEKAQINRQADKNRNRICRIARVSADFE